MVLPLISNRAARRLLLASQGLADDPTRRLDPARLLDLIERMGFVQLDSIKTVSAPTTTSCSRATRATAASSWTG